MQFFSILIRNLTYSMISSSTFITGIKYSCLNFTYSPKNSHLNNKRNKKSYSCPNTPLLLFATFFSDFWSSWIFYATGGPQLKILYSVNNISFRNDPLTRQGQELLFQQTSMPCSYLGYCPENIVLLVYTYVSQGRLWVYSVRHCTAHSFIIQYTDV